MKLHCSQPIRIKKFFHVYYSGNAGDVLVMFNKYSTGISGPIHSQKPKSAFFPSGPTLVLNLKILTLRKTFIIHSIPRQFTIIISNQVNFLFQVYGIINSLFLSFPDLSLWERLSVFSVVVTDGVLHQRSPIT